MEVVDDQYTHNSYCLIKTPDENFQVKVSSTAPVSVLSRDNFVSYTSSMFTMVSMIMMMALAEDNVDIYDFKTIELDEPIGDVDMMVVITMTKNGLQLKMIVGNDVNENITMTWAEFFEE